MNADGTMTMEECQRAWAASCVGPEVARPDCYNRRDYNAPVTSAEFPSLTWTTHWRQGCAHWHAGGNAHVRQWCDNQGGSKTPWHACHGCRHKDGMKGVQ